MKKKSTQRDVAERAGVHPSTVSLALRKHPSIPPGTRERIERAAADLGYAPDPVLAALSDYRRRCRSRSFQGGLAWVASRTPDFDWKRNRTFRQYLEGARRRAADHGYQLEVMELEPGKLGPRRVSSILKAKNIKGILLCPQPTAESCLELDWSSFSCVTFGYSLSRPQLHTVAPSQFRAMARTMEVLHQRGYRRVAFAFSPEHDRRADHNYLGAYLAAQHGTGAQPLICDCRPNAPAAFRSWFDEVWPDAIVTGYSGFLALLEKAGLRAPQEIGLASPVLVENGGRIAGIYENSVRIGEIAVDHLAQLILRGERGIPGEAQRIHIEGLWVEGETLRGAADAGSRVR